MKPNKKLAVTGAALAALISTAVIAGPMYWEERVYYSDATYTQIVGDGSLTCTGNLYVSGTKTNYYKVLIREKCFGY